MSALKQQANFASSITAATPAANWQIDRARGLASHISGLTVQLQVRRQGSPALDLGGLSKIKGTVWAGKIEQLVSDAVRLLDA